MTDKDIPRRTRQRKSGPEATYETREGSPPNQDSEPAVPPAPNRVPVPLTPEQLQKANTKAQKIYLGKSPVIREPVDNVYGRFKVLPRSDHLFVVYDPEKWPPNGPVFWTESDARLASAIAAGEVTLE